MLKTLWWSTIMLLGGLGYAAFEAGALVNLWYADQSKLSFAIIAIFLYSFIKLGIVLHSYHGANEDDIDSGLEACDQSMALGMLGTVIGFILMTAAFASVTIDDISSVRKLITLAINGMSTALYTTATGLISSIVLRVFYYLTKRKYL